LARVLKEPADFEHFGSQSPLEYWLLLLSPKGSKLFSSWGDLGYIFFYLLLFVYIALAKTVLIPIVTGVIEHILA
jgi:hypothetical protein